MLGIRDLLVLVQVVLKMLKFSFNIINSSTLPGTATTSSLT